MNPMANLMKCLVPACALSLIGGCVSVPTHVFHDRVVIDPPFSITNSRQIYISPTLARGSNENSAQALQLALENKIASQGIECRILKRDDKIVSKTIQPEIIHASYHFRQTDSDGTNYTRQVSRYETVGRSSEISNYFARYVLHVRYNFYGENGELLDWKPVVQTTFSAQSRYGNDTSEYALMRRSIESNIFRINALIQSRDVQEEYRIGLVDDTTKSIVPLLDKGEYSKALEILTPAWQKFRNQPVHMTGTPGAVWQNNLGILHELTGNYSIAIDFYKASYERFGMSFMKEPFSYRILRCYLLSGGRAQIPDGF